MDRGTLHTEIAQRLFGWTWREDVQALCPPSWPQDLGSVLGVRDPGDGTLTIKNGEHWESNRVPSYTTDPVATALVWAWVFSQPQVNRASILQKSNGDMQVDLTQWPTESFWVTGYGPSYGDALGHAALALKAALTPARS